MNQPDPQSDGQASQSADQSPSSRIRSEGATLAEGARRDLDQVAQQASADVNAIKHGAEEQIGAAAEKAKSFASEQKDFLAGQITGIADAMSKVAGELDQSDQRTVARYARDIAGGLSSLGRQVEGNDMDQLMGKAQSFGRQQPLAFLGASALAGFLASRFAMASAQRNAAKDSPASAPGQSGNPDGPGGQS